jgi:RHS repeat-associated protein
VYLRPARMRAAVARDSKTVSWRARPLAVSLPLVLAAGYLAAPGASAVAAAVEVKKCAASAADETTALINARLCGHEIAIEDATTPTSVAVAMPSGQVRQTISAAPVRVNRNGSWVPVDLTLVRNADGTAVPRAATSDLVLAGPQATGGTHTLATVGTGEARVSVGWTGKLAEPVLEGSQATYPEALPGVDLVVQATRTGVETFLMVKSRAAAAQIDDVKFPVTGAKISSHRVDADGNTTLLNSAGKAVAAIPAPLMWDARTKPGTGEPAELREVPAKVSKRAARVAKPKKAADGAGVQFTLGADKAFFEAADTVYPVTVDPQVNPLNTTFDTYVKRGSTADHGGANDLQLGLISGNPTRSFVHWDSSRLVGKQITAATVYFYNFWSHTCTATSWEIWSTNAASADTRWTNQPAWNHKEATSTATKGGSSCTDGWVTVSGNSFFQRAATAGSSRAYMGIRATNEADANAFKQFRSRNADNSAQVPYAVVTYNSYPVVGARSTAPASSCVTGAGRPYVNSATPTLRAVLSDGESSPVKGVFEWYNAAGTKIGGVTTASAASGSTVSTIVPAGAFANGGTYKWRVAGNDATVNGPWSSYCELTVDTTAPSAAPIVDSSTYPAGGAGGAAGTAGTFSFSANGVTDAAAFLYGLDTNPPTTVVNATSVGGSATVSITPATAGTHTLYVRSRDRAGNLSPIKAHTFTVDSKVGAVTSPGVGDLSAGKVVLSGEGSATSTAVTYQWRRGETDAWAAIPAGDVTRASGGAAVTWPLATTGSGKFADLNWNVEATVNAAEAGPDALDGPLQVRASFTGGTAGTSTPVRFLLDRDRADAPSTDIGPGTVNQLTGNYTITATDAQDSGLGVMRSFSTRQADVVDPLFGPGWSSATEVLTAGTYQSLTVTGSLVQIAVPGGDGVSFTKKATTGTGASFEPQVGSEELALEYLSSGSTYRLTDANGNITTFTRRSTDPANLFTPASAIEYGTGETTSLSWEKATVGGVDVVRPTQAVATTSAEVDCKTAPLTTAGCQTVTYTYAGATTATAGTDGEYTGRLKQISYTAYDPATQAMATVALARYGYDTTGRLRSAWDPRWDYTELGVTRHAATTYGYHADGTLASVTPSGEQSWMLTYTTIPGDAGKGRLSKVSRSALDAGTSVGSVIYRVPLTGAGAPADLSAAQTARWGQQAAPVDATAVFPPTQIPDGNPAGGVLPSSWAQANVTYMDGNARAVNSLSPGQPVTSTRYDLFGNIVQELTAANLARALNASPNDSAAAEAAIASTLSTTTVYSNDGIRVTEIFGPEHDVNLADWNVVRGRSHTVMRYDEGAPDPSREHHLVTTEIQSLRYWNQSGAAVDTESRTTKTAYDWNLNMPTATIVDPAGLALTSAYTYDSATGQETSSTIPAGDGTTAATRTTVYYRAGTGSGYEECDGHPAWAGLICRTGPAGQPQTDPEIPATFTAYDLYGNPTTSTEVSSSGPVRTTTITYDQAVRVSTVSITAGEALGQVVETRRTVYDPSTGNPLRTEQLDSSGAVTAQILRSYDGLSRMSSYTDADGNQSTATFDIASRVQSVNDGKSSTTMGYDTSLDRRGLANRIIDGQGGTFTGTFNADGQLETETRPDGLTMHRWYDEEGTPTGVAYNQADGTTVYADWAGVDSHGAQKWNADTFSWGGYTYDDAGRLVGADTTTATEGCVSRSYGFDKNSNRDVLRTYGAAADGSCQWNSPATTRTWQYDNADRLINGGYSYDDLGRTLTVPAADVADTGGGDVTIGYYTNDLARSITQGANATVSTLDVMTERFRGYRTDTASGTATRVNHYADDSDTPAWIDEGNGYSRTIRGLSGLTAIHQSATGQTQWQLVNLHGDVVATRDAASGGLLATYLTDEYGVAASKPRYGYLGTNQRSGDNTAGFLTMGVRLYNPVTGRFLSTDVVYGGNANPYDYCSGDPVNCADLTGKYPKPPKLTKAEQRRCKKHPVQCGKWAAISGWAATTANKYYASGPQQNAFRHCIWSAMLSFVLGNKTAYKWNEAHETGDPRDPDDIADRHNNYYGRGVGDWARLWKHNNSQARNWACHRCRELLREGTLKIVKGTF